MTEEHTAHHRVVHKFTDASATASATEAPSTTIQGLHLQTNPFTGRLNEGSIVHYVLESGNNKSAHRPAIVVRNWRQPNGLVQLQVFTDGSNDFPATHPASSGLYWATSVHYSADQEPGTWHWPEE